MSLSNRVPIHGGHPMCECGECHDTLLISWGLWKGLQKLYGNNIYVVVPSHAWKGTRVLASTPLFDVVKEQEEIA